MAYQVLLPYSGLQCESGAVGLASRLADLLQAQVDTLFVSQPIVPLSGLDQEGFDHIRAAEGLATANEFLDVFYRSKHKARAAAARETHDRLLGTLAAKGRFAWHEQGDVFQEAATLLQYEGFLHDLTLCSFAISPPVLDTLIEYVLLPTGRPVLMVAELPPRTTSLTTVVAWKPVPQTVRGITASLPLLRASDRCIVVGIDEGERSEAPTANDVARYLSGSGVEAEAIELDADQRSAQVILEELCQSIRADVLVMGAYSRSRLKALLFGGFTRHFLNQRRCNVLMTS